MITKESATRIAVVICALNPGKKWLPKNMAGYLTKNHANDCPAMVTAALTIAALDPSIKTPGLVAAEGLREFLAARKAGGKPAPAHRVCSTPDCGQRLTSTLHSRCARCRESEAVATQAPNLTDLIAAERAKKAATADVDTKPTTGVPPQSQNPTERLSA